MKKILVCSDLLDDTIPALVAARKYALAYRAENVEVTLLFVLDTPVSYVAPIGLGPGWIDLEPTIQEGELRANERLRDIAAQYFSEFSPTVVVKRSVHAVYEEIVKYADEHQMDLIIVAKHSRSTMERFLLGSVTTKVVQLSHCPVLVVPVKAPPRPAA